MITDGHNLKKMFAWVFESTTQCIVFTTEKSIRRKINNASCGESVLRFVVFDLIMNIGVPGKKIYEQKLFRYLFFRRIYLLAI